MEPWWNPRGTLAQGRPVPPRSLSGNLSTGGPSFKGIWFRQGKPFGAGYGSTWDLQTQWSHSPSELGPAVLCTFVHIYIYIYIYVYMCIYIYVVIHCLYNIYIYTHIHACTSMLLVEKEAMPAWSGVFSRPLEQKPRYGLTGPGKQGATCEDPLGLLGSKCQSESKWP